MNETLRIINNRKSVRKFADEKINRDNINLMLASCDAFIAAQNSVIAAESLGLGSCYIGDIMENYEIHQEMFNLPEYTFPITMLCFGYPVGDYTGRQITPRYPQELSKL